MGVKLAAYMCCIGLTLKHAHELCSRATKSISSLNIPTGARSALACLAALIPFALTLAITVFFALLTQPNPFPVLGLTWDSYSPGLAWSGVIIGFCCVMLMFACGLLMGFIKIVGRQRAEPAHDAVTSFCGGTTDYIAGAVLEEIVTRGYIYYVLNAALGWTAAVVVSAVIFSLVHLVRPSRLPFLFTVNAFIFGLLTGVCRYYTGSLWLPIGLHLAWNVTAGPVLGLPYSGSAYEKGIIRSEVSGPEWLTGGFYSPDAGMFGTCALVLAAVGLRFIAPVL